MENVVVANQTPPVDQQQQVVQNQGVGFGNSSLYVGDLDHSITEAQLYDLFNSVAQVESIRICRDQVRRFSLGYAYVNYRNHQDAVNAMEVLNFTPVNGKPIRIMHSHRDPSIRKSGFANIYIKNLDTSLDNKALHDTFVTFGTVLSCKVATDNNGQSKGYGFVQFEKEEAAQKAIESLNGMLINDKKVYVGLFVRKHERDQANGSPKFTNVFVKNMSEATSDEDLKKVFGNYGSITSAVVMMDADGNSKGFGFVNFQNPGDAATAVEKLNGTTKDDKVWYVGRAQRKSEREAELKAKFEQERNIRLEKLQGANLYLKNLDESINDEKLKELFSEFGSITSSKVMFDPRGVSKGSGFVAFSTAEEATRAVTEMNGKMICRKPLYVAVAQCKEERRARLQAHFAQIRAPGAMAPLPSGMTGFHPGGPRLAPQQLYFGQGTPGLFPSQPGYGFQQQVVPGIRPGVGSNFMMPYLQRQGQPGQRMGLRRGGNPQQQMMQRISSQGFRPLAPIMVPVEAPRNGSVHIKTLASTLVSADPELQRQMLGEQLFPLVQSIEHDYAGKVTGMLLEMDKTEVLHLIESPDALNRKVSEAMDVLQRAGSGTDAADQLGSLSLN